MKRLKSYLEWIEQNIIIVIPIYCLYFIVIILFFQIISRTLFGYSVRWIEELGRYLTICMVFFAGIIALKRGQLVGIKYIYNRFPGKYQSYVSIIIDFLIFLFLIVMTYFGFKLSILNLIKGQLSPALRIPMGWIYLIIPLGGIFMIIFTIFKIFSNLSIIIRKKD